MTTSSNPRSPLREPKRKRDTDLDFFGLGSDDDDFCTPPGATRKVRPTTPLTPRSPNAAASPCGPKSTASEGKKRKKPTVSTGKKKIRHDYRPVDPQYERMTTERLFSEGHIAMGSFSYNHPQFAEEAAAFNGVKIDGKSVWQQQPCGPSTLHNNVTIIDRFPSLAPFLVPLDNLCKRRDSTVRLFVKQRAQQYTTSGRRHRDGKNGRWRMCITVHNPGAPLGFKRLEVGVADARVAKGDQATNPWQLKADGTPDMECIDCTTGSYQIMDEVGTGTASHAHHQAIIDKNPLPQHGAPTMFVVDFDPISPHTFVDDVERIAEGTADKVKAGVGVPAYVPPPTQAQIGRSCGSTQTSDWNRLNKEKKLENYIQDRRDGGRVQSPHRGFGVGKPSNSGDGHAARDFSEEGSGERYYGLHLALPTKDLRAQLPLLVQPDGSLKEPPL
ncbi:hypothetical protein Esi_0148_0019 [Ectocarpus siliculosus]|uniref:Uncharacterized protein n=1 Tax=Ectocarpus siliculosus TaxID=2880 RepID=D8LFC5_ECTSI|nr:hypothetical protein Esi_0148_0019 [Ectocarpus siliculosus]|eukprot:CBN75585.1 hypothetical protein Esi_0148_0019 [Ectocarpus siliculosus]